MWSFTVALQISVCKIQSFKNNKHDWEFCRFGNGFKLLTQMHCFNQYCFIHRYITDIRKCKNVLMWLHLSLYMWTIFRPVVNLIGRHFPIFCHYSHHTVGKQSRSWTSRKLYTLASHLNRLILTYTLLNVIFHNTSSFILEQPIIFSFQSFRLLWKNAPGAVKRSAQLRWHLVSTNDRGACRDK